MDNQQFLAIFLQNSGNTFFFIINYIVENSEKNTLS